MERNGWMICKQGKWVIVYARTCVCMNVCSLGRGEGSTVSCTTKLKKCREQQNKNENWK